MLSPLYIDPGTGSALFSILIAGAATVYFLGRALIIKAKLFFSGGRAEAESGTTPCVVYCEDARYWNLFKPVLDEFEARSVPLLYLTSAQTDPVFSSNYSHIKAQYIGTGNKAFARLNLLRANVVLMTTPGLDVYQLKRSKGVKHYSHILHATSDATMYRLFGIDYFDSVLLTGAYQVEDIRELEKQRGLPAKDLVVVGCGYLDVTAQSIAKLKTEAERPFTVLVSPSWGASGLLAKYGERLLNPLAETGWRIIVRPHPQSKKSEGALLDSLMARYSNSPNIIWDYEPDNTASLSKSDIMISDFSGIIYDYIFLFDKPVIYVNNQIDLRPYDADDLGEDAAEKLWQFKTLKKIGIELKEDMFCSIREIIKNAGDNEVMRNARKQAKTEAWYYQGEAGKRVTDFLLEHSA